MAVATDQDRTIRRNQDVILPFVIAGEDGSAYTWEYTIRYGHEATATLTITGGAIVATYDAGDDETTVEVTLTDTQTDLTCRTYRHGLWRTDAGEQAPYADGELRIAPSSHKV